MAALWLKNAQPKGVAKIKTKPQNRVWMGALALGKRLRKPPFSNLLMSKGVSTEKKLKKKQNKNIWNGYKY